MERKMCSRCGVAKAAAEWHASQWVRAGRWCKACMSSYYKAKSGPASGETYDPRPCAWCSSAYTPRTRNKVSIYCSRDCKTESRKSREREERRAQKAASEQRSCAFCALTIPTSKRVDARFCSDLCGQRAHGRITTNRRRNRKVYLEVLMHSGAICRLCSDSVSLAVAWPHPMSPSIDHVVPVSLGGTDDLTNLRLTHLACNVRRGNRLDQETPHVEHTA